MKGSQNIMDLPIPWFPDGESTGRPNVLNRGPEMDCICPRGCFPAGGLLVEGSQLVNRHRERQGLWLSWSQQFSLSKSLEFSRRLLQTSGRRWDIDLNDFLSGHGAGVGHSHAGSEPSSQSLDDLINVIIQSILSWQNYENYSGLPYLWITQTTYLWQEEYLYWSRCSPA